MHIRIELHMLNVTASVLSALKIAFDCDLILILKFCTADLLNIKKNNRNNFKLQMKEKKHAQCGSSNFSYFKT